MFEFFRYPGISPNLVGYYYTYTFDINDKIHVYKTKYWDGFYWENERPEIVLGFIPESHQLTYLDCVFWSSENKIKPF